MNTEPESPSPSASAARSETPAANNPSETQFVPMTEESPSLINTFDALLKMPGSVLHHLHHADSPHRVVGHLLLTTAVCLTVFGLMAGTFSGGMQLWAAPLKIVFGVFASALICLPSLYIFACLSGYDVTARSVVGVLAAILCLTALLLLGFTPVVWIFSQSITSLTFMGFLLLAFWSIAICFGLSLLFRSARFLGAQSVGHLSIWTLVFFTVALQMSTTLRPIIGRADEFLPSEKRFFLNHWLKATSENYETRETRGWD